MNSTDLWDILGIFRIHTRLFYSRSLSSAMPALEQGDPDIMVRVEGGGGGGGGTGGGDD
jgi:hypothetical protein